MAALVVDSSALGWSSKRFVLARSVLASMISAAHSIESVIGNLGQIYARDGWRFHREMVEKYGGAVKVHGLLGVRLLTHKFHVGIFNYIHSVIKYMCQIQRLCTICSSKMYPFTKKLNGTQSK